MIRIFNSAIFWTLSFAISLMAQYPTVSINQIQTVPPGYEISPYAGQTVVTGGIVTVPTDIFYAGPGLSFFIEEQGGGRFSGILSHYASSQGFPTLLPGDSVTFTATVTDDIGAMTILLVEGPLTINPGYSVPMPEIIMASLIDSSDNSDFLAERYEGVLCRINNITIDSVIVYSNSSIWLCHDSSGLFIIREYSDSISFLPSAGMNFDYIQGVVYHRQGVYELWPRYTRDCVARINGPIISDITMRPLQPSSEGDITFLAKVADSDTITSVFLHWTDQDGPHTERMEGYYGIYSYRLETQSPDTRINYYLTAINNHGDTTKSPSEAPLSYYSFRVLPEQTCQYLPGDANGDGLVNLADADYLMAYYGAGGLPPLQYCFYSNSGGNFGLYTAADANGDCRNTGSDVTRIVMHIRNGFPIKYCPYFPPMIPTPWDDEEKITPTEEGHTSD
jgi:hypothetical protein